MNRDDLEMGKEVIVEIPGLYTFNGIVVGKATTDITANHIIKCTDGFIPNETYAYDTTSVPLSYIKEVIPLKEISYDEAFKKSLSVKWKTLECGSPNCWCLMVAPVETIPFGNDDEFYIATSGTLDREIAEYIVKLHNGKIN